MPSFVEDCVCFARRLRRSANFFAKFCVPRGSLEKSPPIIRPDRGVLSQVFRDKIRIFIKSSYFPALSVFFGTPKFFCRNKNTALAGSVFSGFRLMSAVRQRAETTKRKQKKRASSRVCVRYALSFFSFYSSLFVFIRCSFVVHRMSVRCSFDVRSLFILLLLYVFFTDACGVPAPYDFG